MMNDSAVIQFFMEHGQIIVDEAKIMYYVMLFHNSGYRGGIVLRYYSAGMWYIEKEIKE